jgi:AcrB/AcrD/AcrF family
MLIDILCPDRVHGAVAISCQERNLNRGVRQAASRPGGRRTRRSRDCSCTNASSSDPNDMLCFHSWVVPLAVATGAGAEMRQSLGTAVLFGMLGVTGFGLLFTPIFASGAGQAPLVFKTIES